MHREHAIQYLVSRLDEYSYVTTLVALVPQLPASMIGRVFEKTVALEREGDQARLLVALSPRLSDEHMVEAFVTALKLPADQRPQVLGSLLEHMTASVLERVLHEIAMLSPGSVRQEALTVLAPQLNGKLLEQALIIAGTLGGAENTDWILHDLARLLAPPLPKEALATASRIQDETLRSDTLLMLGVYVTGEERHKALELALSSEPGEYRMMHRVETLTEVAHHLVGEDKKRVVEQALNFIRDRISDKLSQAELFAGLMAYLTDTEQITVLEQVLNILDSLTDEEARADTLIELLPYMPDQQQAWAVEQALKTVKGTSADLLQIERANLC